MTDIYEYVIDDLRTRMEHGMQEYGVPLTGFNGRDALTDAYEEIQDACLYLRQAIFEERAAEHDPRPEIGHLVIKDVRTGWIAPDAFNTLWHCYEHMLQWMLKIRAELAQRRADHA